MPGTKKLEHVTTANGSDLRQLEIQYNNLAQDYARACLGLSTCAVWAWSTAASNSGQALGRGSNDTDIASGAFVFAINGNPEAKAAVTTGTAPTAQTVPADTWALYALDAVAGGTLSVAPAAANATTGYATEALAIAALPARITAKARLGYITVKTASGLAWVGATDGLAGGTSGNEASQTNYYPYDGLFAPTGQSYGPNGVVTAYVSPTGSAWNGGRNGVVIPTVMAIGSNDYAVATTAFVYNANGVCGINKAAVTAGSAFGALGTIPAATWGVFVGLINSVNTVTWLAGPSNFTSGYKNEAAAIGDLNKIFPTATSTGGLCMFGYCTVQAQSGNAWITGTDALAGGTTGNEAAGTNYYPNAGVTFTSAVQGEVASLIATPTGKVISSTEY